MHQLVVAVDSTYFKRQNSDVMAVIKYLLGLKPGPSITKGIIEASWRWLLCLKYLYCFALDFEFIQCKNLGSTFYIFLDWQDASWNWVTLWYFYIAVGLWNRIVAIFNIKTGWICSVCEKERFTVTLQRILWFKGFLKTFFIWTNNIIWLF